MMESIRQKLAIRKKRSGIAHVVNIAVALIVFATLGVAALTILFSATTSNWGTTVPVIAITVTAILASLAVALSFFKGHGARL